MNLLSVPTSSSTPCSIIFSFTSYEVGAFVKPFWTAKAPEQDGIIYGASEGIDEEGLKKSLSILPFQCDDVLGCRMCNIRATEFSRASVAALWLQLGQVREA